MTWQTPAVATAFGSSLTASPPAASLPWSEWQFWLVTVLALAALVAIVRPMLPARRTSPACPGCGPPTPGRRTTTQLTVDGRRA